MGVSSIKPKLQDIWRTYVVRKPTADPFFWPFIKVVAATNQVAKLSPELKSRFAIRTLEPYDTAQYRTVVKGVLVRREDANPELAEEIAQRLEGKSQDARDAVRLARLSPQLSTDKAINLLLS